MRIGVDVGGTNTDAAILDGRVVLATAKRPTTADVTGGIVAALGAILAACPAARGAIDAIMIGTTHFTNAVIQRRGLVPTAAIRLGLPATASVPPLIDWPPDLRAAIGGHAHLIQGASSSMAARSRRPGHGGDCGSGRVAAGLLAEQRAPGAGEGGGGSGRGCGWGCPPRPPNAGGAGSGGVGG